MLKVDPILKQCAQHVVILLALKGAYLCLNILMSASASEWAFLTVFSWFVMDSYSLTGELRAAERSLDSLVARCDASLRSIHDLALRYDAVDRRCQAATLKHLRARDANIREMNWMAFCRRVICFEHVRMIRRDCCGEDCAMRRPASDGNMQAQSCLMRTHSLS